MRSVSTQQHETKCVNSHNRNVLFIADMEKMVVLKIIIIIVVVVVVVIIIRNQQVQTDRTIHNNKPDIIIRDNEKRTCMLIDVAISGDRNVIKREAEKILKYKDLTIEIQRMWNVKTKEIPVIIIGAAGTISKSFRKYVSNISGNHEVKELQKTAILGTAHIFRKVLM